MKKYMSVLALFLCAVLLRFWGLGQIPSGLNRDEAALAYNAYLLQQTGYDEWHHFWPIALRSFGDYKLVGYPAIVSGLFTFLPLADWVVRLPAAVAGVGIVGIMMLISRDVFQFSSVATRRVGWFSATLPVCIFYARMAFEATVGLAALLLLLWVLFVPRQKKEYSFWRFPVALILAAAAFLTYNTPWILFPFVLISLFYWHWPSWRWGLSMCVLTALVWIVVGLQVLPVTQQKSGITIFEDETLWVQSVSYYQQWPTFLRPVFGNRYVFFAKQAGVRYLATLGPQFLVMQGGQHPWHTLPGWGHMSLLVYLLGWLGIGSVFWQWLKHHTQPSKTVWLLLFWTSIAPLPAVITVDAPHATRSLFFFMCWIWWAVLGTDVLGRVWRYSSVVVWLLLGLSTIWYCLAYVGQYREQSRVLFQSGVAEVAAQTRIAAPTSPIAIIDEGGYLYATLAWYLRVPPAVFFETIVRHLPDKIGFSYGYRLTNFRFIKAAEDRIASESFWIVWDSSQGKWLQSGLK